MVARDDVEAYLDTFEHIAKWKDWDPANWAQILTLFLTGEAQLAFYFLHKIQAHQYETLMEEMDSYLNGTEYDVGRHGVLPMGFSPMLPSPAPDDPAPKADTALATAHPELCYRIGQRSAPTGPDRRQATLCAYSDPRMFGP